ncbi:4125_t:CDS:2, partial [Entrophospora sp. SA101]
QMFFNAMKRKNWNPNTEDMKVIVPIHNAVNEKAWKEILEWEKLHENKCGGPRLINFQGRSKDFTPKARILNLLGYKLPFDRHDWVIDRCGKHVTYIIDFYSGQPDPKFPERVASFYLDVRPALTFNGTIDRIRKWVNSCTTKIQAMFSDKTDFDFKPLRIDIVMNQHLQIQILLDTLIEGTLINFDILLLISHTTRFTTTTNIVREATQTSVLYFG